jgi:hypothetical protein
VADVVRDVHRARAVEADACAGALAREGDEDLGAVPQSPLDRAAPASYGKDVRPLFARYCHDRHGGAEPKADLEFESFRDEAAVLESRRTWKRVYEMLRSDDMPLAGKPQPTPAERERLTDWVEAVLEKPPFGGEKDPGPVVIRRLDRIE